MIKCEITKNSTKTEICGSNMLIMAELTTLIKEVREGLAKKHGQESADNDIRECIKLSFMTCEEIEAEKEEIKRELMKDMGISEEKLNRMIEAICD